MCVLHAIPLTLISPTNPSACRSDCRWPHSAIAAAPKQEQSHISPLKALIHINAYTSTPCTRHQLALPESILEAVKDKHETIRNIALPNDSDSESLIDEAVFQK